MTKTLVLLCAASILMTACATKPKTNAQKCAEMGGTYTASTRSCQFQSGTE